MTITYHHDIIQYSPEWEKARCGLLTASKIDTILTPTKLEIAKNQGSRDLVDAIACQRVTGLSDPTFQSFDMRRGLVEESLARKKYNDNYAPVKECGFVMNDKWGFTLGCSPDGLVGDDGGLEIKSRLNKLQFGVIRAAKMPDEYRLQVQTFLMITERPWLDFISYSGGMNMITIRVLPDPVIFKAIENAAFDFEARVKVAVEEYGNRLADSNLRILPTEKTPEEGEIIIETEEAA